MAGKKLKDFLSGRGYTATRIDYRPHPTGGVSPSEGFGGGENAAKVKEHDDLEIEPNTLIDTKELVNEWVAWTQENADIVFGVSDGVSPNVEIVRGQPIEHADQYGVNRVYIKTSTGADADDSIPGASSSSPIDTSHLAPTLTSWSNSGKFDDSYNSSTGENETPHTLGNFLNKTTSIDGHYLLAGFAGNKNRNLTGKTFLDVDKENINSAVKSSYDILNTINKWKPNDKDGGGGKAFAPSDGIVDQSEAGTTGASGIEGFPTLDTRPFAGSQRAYGKNFKSGDDGAYEADMSFNNLKSIAFSMLLKSSGYNWEADPEAFDFLDPNLKVPDENGSGISRITRQIYQARNAFGSPQMGPKDANDNTVAAATVSSRAERGEFVQQLGPEKEESKSYGHITTPNSPFQSTATIARATAALITLKAAKAIFADGWMTMATGDQMILGRGPLLLGSSNLKSNPGTRLLMSSLFIPTTQKTYEDCVDFGAKILFGDGWKDEDSKEIASSGGSSFSRSAGYYHVVARAALRSIDKFSSAISATDAGSTQDIVQTIAQTGVVGFMNTLATIGNIGFMRSKGKSDVSKAASGTGPFDVDKFPDGPATRVGKSRTQDGFNQNALSMRTSATPSLYMIPKNIIRAANKLGTLGIGTNPSRGMLGSSLGTKTYLDQNLEDGNARIPNDVVEKVENLLDAEYVPFYFHDLRTNEIIAFHAFLDNLTDSYNPRFNAMSGYGRIDPVQVYQTTTRNISLDFHIAATSQEDFDEMWFKINKLVTLVYPQWTEGTKVKSAVGAVGKEENYEFIQPFSQVLGATPLIRLRVGDVIKSNYSKFHLARMFGIGNQDTVIPAGGGPLALTTGGKMAEFFMDAFYAIYGSPLQYIQIDGKPDLTRALRGAASALLTNGFANPLWSIVVGRLLRDPDSSINPAPYNITLAAVGENELGPNGSLMQGVQGKDGKGFGYHTYSIVFLKPTMGRGYVNNDGAEYRFDRPVKCMIMGRNPTTIEDISSAGSSPGMRGSESYATRGSGSRMVYEVSVIDIAASTDILFTKFLVTHSDLVADPDFVYNLYVAPLIDPLGAIATLGQSIINEVALAAGVPTDTVQLTASPEADFMNANNNTIVKSFNMMKGRGLAGVISKLTFTLLDDTTTWEIDWNSRAPKIVKVSMAFDVIHDLPPGLGHDGFNRAPIYNVGRVMKSVAGDPYDDNGAASHLAYRADGRKTTRKTGQIDEIKKKQGKKKK